MTIVKYDLHEMAEIIAYEFEDENDVCTHEEIEVYHEAQRHNYTQCSCCEQFVSYDDHSGEYGMCDDCCAQEGLALDYIA